MAKKYDFAKAKALAQEFIKCIGDCDEGEDPSLPKPKNDVNDGGVEPNTQFLKTAEADEDETGVGGSKEGKGLDDIPEGKKKKKEASLALMGSMLASKVKSKGY